MSSHHGHDKPSAVNRKLKELLQRSDNRFCADCGALDPKWASSNIGVFICLKCSDVHRHLGTDISKILSVTIDEWSEDEIDFMVEIGGNSYANAIYEAFLPEGFTKPGPHASVDQRTKFIRSKYELQEFLKPSLRIASLSSSRNSLQSSDSGKDLDEGLESEVSNTGQARTVESVGVLRVKVVKGSNLAVRDMLSSDPYVVLLLGRQRVQTHVVPSNLNPIWNEELQLSVPENYGPMKVQVFDHDSFSADDIMGEAEVDLQPLITSAMAFGDPDLLGNMQIGRWLKSHDNALIEDSPISIIDGKVRQDVSLKLQNVESGEVELQMEWRSLRQ